MVVHGQERLANLPEHDARRRMHMCHGTDVGSRGVDARMDPELGIGLALTFAPVAVQVEDEQPRGIG